MLGQIGCHPGEDLRFVDHDQTLQDLLFTIYY
jgi:hypothetical protein